MKILKRSLRFEMSKCIYWTVIVFFSNDETKKTKLFISASIEYFSDIFNNGQPDDQQLDDFLSSVIKKWGVLGYGMFNQDCHYDVYASTPQGEAKQLNFLIEKSKS